MISPKVAAEIGNRLGTVELVEKRSKHEAHNVFMRVRVAIPISKPIQKGGFVAGSDRERCWVNFKYERLPLFCHHYGLLGTILSIVQAIMQRQKMKEKCSISTVIG